MYVNVELDDKPRRLRYQYNDIADVEEKAGLGIAAIFNEDRIGFHSIRLLIWGGLKWADHGLTIHRAGPRRPDGKGAAGPRAKRHYEIRRSRG